MDLKTLTGLEADVLKAVMLSQRVAKKAVELAAQVSKLDALTCKIEATVRPETLAALEAYRATLNTEDNQQEDK